jgi:hypothetical protein
MATVTHIHTHQEAHISPISPLNKHHLQQNKMNNYHQKVKQLRRFIMSLVNLRKIYK